MSGRRRARWAEESGSALIAALVVTVIVLMLGLAVLATSQNQLSLSATSRVRDSSFQLAEGALYAQGFLLPANWPGTPTSGDQFKVPCSSATGATTNPSCPDRNTLAAANAANPSLTNFSSSDYQDAYGSTCPTSVTAASGVTCWITEVRDDGGALSQVFKASQADAAQGSCPGPCSWDANGNKQVWVYSRAFVHGKARALAAKLKLEQINEGLASAGFRVGHVTTDNDGNKVIVDGTGAQVLVNCDPDQSSCVDARAGQVTPTPTQIPGGNVFMSAAQLARFKAAAIADGRYYPGCPDDLSGKVVWVENCNASFTTLPSVSCVVPTQSGNAKCINTPVGQGTDCAPQACPAGMLGGPGPGLLIWHHGTLAMRGQETFVGTIYMPNGSDEGSPAPDPVFTTGGTAAVYGSLAVDGNGGVVLGASKANFIYDANSSGVFKSYGTAGLVQNTWQELPPSGG